MLGHLEKLTVLAKTIGCHLIRVSGMCEQAPLYLGFIYVHHAKPHYGKWCSEKVPV